MKRNRKIIIFIIGGIIFVALLNITIHVQTFDLAGLSGLILRGTIFGCLAFLIYRNK